MAPEPAQGVGHRVPWAADAWAAINLPQGDACVCGRTNGWITRWGLVRAARSAKNCLRERHVRVVCSIAACQRGVPPYTNEIA